MLRCGIAHTLPSVSAGGRAGGWLLVAPVVVLLRPLSTYCTGPPGVSGKVRGTGFGTRDTRFKSRLPRGDTLWDPSTQ